MNHLKNKKQLPLEFVQNSGRPIGSSMFGISKDTTLASFIKKKKNVLLISTMHFGDDINIRTSKPEIIKTYSDTKGGVDMVDNLCAQYKYARATRRWPMVPFYSVINVTGLKHLLFIMETILIIKASKKNVTNAFMDLLYIRTDLQLSIYQGP